MSEIQKWLESIGLDQYAGAFEANDLDMDLVQQVDDQMLKDIGIASAGHRLRIRNAIAKLATASIAEANLRPTTSKHETAAASAERRQVTVMFSDLVGSTALSARMDPEDLREVISAYQRCVAETVRRFDGFVAKYMGDGVLVYFGYPQAHEDDAERAVRAGMELIGAVTALGARVSLRTRIGIATGLVVVGDLVGAGEAQERGIVGETPNLAARLQGIAQPNMVVIAESTRRLLGNLFELEHLGPQDLKGIAGSVPAWAAIRSRSVESRFEAMRTANLTALVGREEESELLMRRWSRARSGQGQVVLISGEAGIGKSRLTAALLENIATEPHTRLRYFCSPQHTDSALYPIIGQMERAAGFVYDDKPQARLDKLDMLLGQTSTAEAALFAEMLSLPNDGRYPTLDLTPQQRRQRTLEALISQLAVLASHSPVLMILEDAHWADPTSLEAFGRIVSRTPTLRVLLIVTFRPEFHPPWVGQPHVMAMTINRLSQRDVDAMIDRVVGNKRLPPSIRQDIIERSDGIPLFIEEMTKAVLEAGGEGAVERALAAVPSSALAVPASLHASLMARLDRLGPAKEIAQIGAAIGREFSHALLASVVRKPEAELGSALDRVVAAGLLLRQGVPPNATYLFKHALVQDAAYGTLLREPRRALHARIAKTLDENFVELRDTQPEILAYHFAQAGKSALAIEWWNTAGERAMLRSAHNEAIVDFERAIGLAETLPDAPPRQLLQLQANYAFALLHGRGTASPQASAAFARVRDLADQIENASEKFSAYYGIWSSSFIRSDLESALNVAQTFVNDTLNRPESPEASVARRILGTTCWVRGDYVEAKRQLEQALAVRDSDWGDDNRIVQRFGYDFRGGLGPALYLGFVVWPLGEFERALLLIEQGINLAAQSKHHATIAVSRCYACLMAAIRGRPAEAALHAPAAVALTGEHGLPYWFALGTAFLGWSRVGISNIKRANEIRRGIALLRDQGVRFMMPLLGTLLAQTEAQAGSFDDALATLEAELAAIDRTGERWFEAEMHRCHGELLLRRQSPDAEAAEAALKRAIEVARIQQTRAFEIRSALALAKLYEVTGRDKIARELLGPAVAGFSEGSELPEVAEANRLLVSLEKTFGRP